MNNCIVYVGDFDLRNENVQAHLVRNNGKILISLGYKLVYIGVNRDKKSFKEVQSLPELQVSSVEKYFEVPDTLNVTGAIKSLKVGKKVMQILDLIKREYCVKYVISYQSPTFAFILKKTVKWCKKNHIKYIVNCADLPIFDNQSFIRRIVMKANWNYMHRVNKRYADGVIAVSKFIEAFYYRSGCPSVIIPPLFDVSQYEFVAPKPEAVISFIYAGVPFKTTGHEVIPVGMKDRLDKVIDIFLDLSSKGVPYCFRIVGIEKDNYLNGVPRHRDLLTNEKNILFMGRLTHSKTLALVAKSDFSINFRDENLMTNAGFSTKVVESVSVGTPVIINPIGDTFEYLEEGVSIFSLNGNIKDDIKKITAICGLSENERIQIKTKCYQSGIFDVNKYKEIMDGFLTSL